MVLRVAGAATLDLLNGISFWFFASVPTRLDESMRRIDSAAESPFFQSYLLGCRTLTLRSVITTKHLIQLLTFSSRNTSKMGWLNSWRLGARRRISSTPL